jgi:hypothetical protein
VKITAFASNASFIDLLSFSIFAVVSVLIRFVILAFRQVSLLPSLPANELMSVLPNNQVLKMLGWFPFHSGS